MIRSHVLICGGTGCTSSGSPAIREHLEKELTAHGLADEIKVVQTGCFGLCALGPIMIVYPEGTFYSRVTEEDVTEIVEEHLLKGRVVDHRDQGGRHRFSNPARIHRQALAGQIRLQPVADRLVDHGSAGFR